MSQHKFEYVNIHGEEVWFVDNAPVSKGTYEAMFLIEHGKKIDYNNVGFEDMLKVVCDREYDGHYSTQHKKYRFYAEESEEFNDIIIRVQFDDEDVEIGNFFQEYEHISEWINYRFTLKKSKRWNVCDFKRANKVYEAGGKVRVEVDGNVEEFIKTAHELKSLVDVATNKQIQSEWEYMI